MQSGIYDLSRLKPGSIVSGNQMRYLASSELPVTLQAVMVQLFSQTDWRLAASGYLQTIPIRIKKIAEALNVSVRSVKRYIASLIKSGELVAHERFGEFGQQMANIFTMPRLSEHLNNLDLKELEEEIGQETLDLSTGQGEGESRGGDNGGTPYRQNSFPKRNTYIHFKEIKKKNEFTALTGSIRYVPQILAVIKRARPKADPDVVYRCFREFISRPDFELQSHIPHYFALLRIFAHKARLPGEFSPQQSTAAKPDREKVDIPEPEISGSFASLRSTLCKEIGKAAYIAWFDGVEVARGPRPDSLKITVRNDFTRGFIERTYGHVLEALACREGLRRVHVCVTTYE